MVKFEIDLYDGKIFVFNVIDDAEGTPGTSRQYTRFNADVLPELKEAMPKSEVPFADLETILDKHNFKIVHHKFQVKNFHNERYINNKYIIKTKE